MARAKPTFARYLADQVVAASIGFLMPSANAAEHTLMPSPQTVHIGHFNAALKPILTIESGDIVTIETSTQIDPADVDQAGVVPPNIVPDYVRNIYREVKDRGPGAHILTGPIFVNGAMPGDVLEVRIQQIDLPSATVTTLNVPTPVRYRRIPGFFRRVIASIGHQDRGDRARRRDPADWTILWHAWGFALGRDGPHQQRSPGRPHRQHRQQGCAGRDHIIHAGLRAGCAVFGWRWSRRPRARGG